MTLQRSSLGLSDIGYHLYTIFLFFKNDILTAIIPATLFSTVSAPLCNPFHAFPMFLWIFLHTLQFEFANQIKGVEEDKVNKPYRPIVAGRITIHDTAILRWLMVPLCLGYSSLFSTQLVFTSLGMQLFTFWYNDMDGDSHWLSKNVLLAAMHSCSGQGAILVASCDPSKPSEAGKLAVQLTIIVIAFTVHAQDFKDTEGDRRIGRCTVPIRFPFMSRFVVGLGIPMWSFLFCFIWDVSWFCTLVLVGYGGFVGGRILFLRKRDADKQSCKYYSVWFTLVHLLPGYWNYFHASNEVPGAELLHNTWGLFSNASLLNGLHRSQGGTSSSALMIQ